MTRYRFAAWLFDGEYETTIEPFVQDRPNARVTVPGYGDLLVPGSVLVEVVPPLPDEPPLHAVVLDGRGRAWQRVETGRGRWCCTQDDDGGGWAEVCVHGAPTLLTLDPFAEPVTLPWADETTYGARIGVRDLDTGSVNEWVHRPDEKCVVATLTPALARAKARALWAAADAAETQS